MKFSAKATILLVFVIAEAASGASTSVSESEQARWVRWLLPLPKQVSIDKKVESHVELGVTDDGRGRAAADQELINLGRRHALKFVPNCGVRGIGPCTRHTKSL